MNKSPSGCSCAGVSPWTGLLRDLLRWADTPRGACFGRDDIRLGSLPAGSIEFLLELGLTREVAPESEVYLWGCPEPRWVEPVWFTNEQTGKTVGYAGCQACGGLHEVDPDRLRRWAVSLEAVAGVLRTSCALSGESRVDVPDRLVYLGALQHAQDMREVFLARGLVWNDAEPMLAQAPRLQASACPAIIALGDLPDRRLWERLRFQPVAVSLAETLEWEEGRVRVPLDRLFGQAPVPAPAVASPQWLSVTQAARLLKKDLTFINLSEARARVSMAATRELFRTNGLKGRKRRIAEGEFALWRLAQRDAGLEG